MNRYALKIVLFCFIFMFAIALWVKQPFVLGRDLGKMPKLQTYELKQDVAKLSTDFAERNFYRPEVLTEAADFIQNSFLKSSKEVVLQTYKVQGVDYSNVIASFGPKDGDPIIIGADYDAFEKTAGADDNASGVAGLLALARIFKDSPPKVPVKLIAYTLEEPPTFRTDAMGSVQHASKLIKDGIKPKLVIVLEMIGYFSDANDSQQYPIELLKWFYPSKANFIGVVGNFSGFKETRLVKAAIQSATDLPVVSINAPSSLVGVDFSDHASYWRYNFPAVMVTDTSFFRNVNYHQASDVATTIDYERMAKVIEGVYGVVKQMELNASH